MNAILSFNEMILDQVYGDISDKLHRPLIDMQQSGRHLLRLIGDVLDLSIYRPPTCPPRRLRLERNVSYAARASTAKPRA